MARPKRETPWLSKRDGIYYVHWYEPGERQTRRLSLRTSRTDEAENRFAEFLLHGREIRDSRPGRLTVEQALEDYLAEHVRQHCADATRQIDAARHLKAFFGDRALETVDIPLTRGYADARRAGLIGGGKRRKAKAGSDSTIRRELVVLGAAANHAKRWKRLGDPPRMPSIELPPERRLGPDDQAPYYERDELERLFSAAGEEGGEIECFVRLLYLTGARRRSIENLTRAQVRWDAKRILLQAPGKRATKKRQPIVPILNAMEPWLRLLWDRGGEIRLFQSQADFYRPYRALCEGAGLADRSHPHVMRHTRATHLLQDGKSIYTVAKLLGDSVATVERVYGHHSADHLANALEE